VFWQLNIRTLIKIIFSFAKFVAEQKHFDKNNMRCQLKNTSNKKNEIQML
jgi:hypothetical protein